jgi:hypothetical protein
MYLISSTLWLSATASHIFYIVLASKRNLHTSAPIIILPSEKEIIDKKMVIFLLKIAIDTYRVVQKYCYQNNDANTMV